MKTYLELLNDILINGEQRDDRTGVGTLSVFGKQLTFDLTKGFPAVTTKKLAWKAVASELLWFIEGSNDERRLAEILHGTRDSEKKTIWTDNAQSTYWKPNASFEGDLGSIYGVQWRAWRVPPKFVICDSYGEFASGPITYVDQLKKLIDGIKRDPTSRRHILTAWNPGEIDMMALPPCHILAQFYVSNDKRLSCHMYQRSVDCFLGLPFNIASYALLTHMIAQSCKLGVGSLVISTGDTHIYTTHVEQVREQLSREPLPLPTLKLNETIREITEFSMDDIHLIDYVSHDTIKATMAV